MAVSQIFKDLWLILGHVRVRERQNWVQQIGLGSKFGAFVKKFWP